MGKAELDVILSEAKESGARMVVLETQTCNENAIAFYKKNGFEIIGFDLYNDSYKAMWELVQFINCASKNGYSMKWELRGAVSPSTSDINWVVDNMK